MSFHRNNKNIEISIYQVGCHINLDRLFELNETRYSTVINLKTVYGKQITSCGIHLPLLLLWNQLILNFVMNSLYENEHIDK